MHPNSVDSLALPNLVDHSLVQDFRMVSKVSADLWAPHSLNKGLVDRWQAHRLVDNLMEASLEVNSAGNSSSGQTSTPLVQTQSDSQAQSIAWRLRSILERANSQVHRSVHRWVHNTDRLAHILDHHWDLISEDQSALNSDQALSLDQLAHSSDQSHSSEQTALWVAHTAKTLCKTP